MNLAEIALEIEKLADKEEATQSTTDYLVNIFLPHVYPDFKYTNAGDLLITVRRLYIHYVENMNTIMNQADEIDELKAALGTEHDEEEIA